MRIPNDKFRNISQRHFWQMHFNDEKITCAGLEKKILHLIRRWWWPFFCWVTASVVSKSSVIHQLKSNLVNSNKQIFPGEREKKSFAKVKFFWPKFCHHSKCYKTFSGEMKLWKCKQLFEYEKNLLISDILWSDF